MIHSIKYVMLHGRQWNYIKKEKPMIQVEKLSYSFPEKDLYKNVSFTLQDGAHCALIGSNGTGKSTLIQMMMEPDEWLYKGKIIRKIK